MDIEKNSNVFFHHTCHGKIIIIVLGGITEDHVSTVPTMPGLGKFCWNWAFDFT
jgi:hypothetical protein